MLHLSAILGLTFAILLAGITAFHSRTQVRQTQALLARGTQALLDRVAPFAWIVQSQDAWHMVPVPRSRWERLAGIAWTQAPAWRKGRNQAAGMVGAAATLIAGGLWIGLPLWQEAFLTMGWAWLMRGIVVALRARQQGAFERAAQCEQIDHRPWAKAWSLAQPDARLPVERMTDEIENQGHVLARMAANPESGDPAARLAELKTQLPPRLIGELLRVMVWRLAEATPSGETGRSLRVAIDLGAPLDHHCHTRQTSLFYQNLPILTVFTGQHDGPDPVMFWIDMLRDVVEALETSPAFDINAVDPANGRPALAELILATEHYLHKGGRRSEASAQDLLEGIALLVEHGADINLALDAIAHGKWLSEPRAIATLRHSGHPAITQPLSERERQRLELDTAPAAGEGRLLGRL